jgi:hypothetical protein
MRYRLTNRMIWRNDQQDGQDVDEAKVRYRRTSRMARIRMKIMDGRICRMTRRG